MPLRSRKSIKSNWFTLNPQLTTTFFFLLLLTIIFLITHQRFQIIKENREKAIRVMLETVDARFRQLLNSSQNIALSIALTLDENGKPRKFEDVAAEILETNPIIQAIELMPEGKIAYIYPLKGNESALGLDIFNTTKLNRIEANKAVTARKMYFQGPVQMVQGNMGVMGRLPLFRDNKFWGFSAVVIHLDSLLKAAGIDNSREFYKFQFSKKNPVTAVEEFFMPEKVNYKDTNYAVKEINEGDWKIYLADTRPVYVDSQLISLGVFGILLSMLSGYLLLRTLNKQLQLHVLLSQQGHQLIATENKYKTIFDNAAIGIGRVNAITGEFLEANAFLCNLIGYSADELTSKKIKSLIHVDDLTADGIKFKRLLAGRIREFSSIRRYIHKSGEIIWANAIVSPLWSEGEEPSDHLVIVDDISSQVAYETKLIASQKHIEELVNSIEGVVWEAKIQGGYSYSFISSKVYDILGYTVEEWLNTPNFLLTHVHDEDRKMLADYIANQLFAKRQHVYEYRMYAKDGTIIWIRDSVTIEPSLEAPEKLRGIMIDITSVKEAEVALQTSFDLVNEQNKRLLNFSYIVSHNLRSHSSNIDGITALISGAESDKERNEMIELLKKVVLNLNDTLYNLNNVVNIQTSINLVKEPLNLRDYLSKTIYTLEAQILNMKADVLNEVSKDVYVNFNRAYLESVLLNLLSNAIRYSHPSRTPSVVISCEPVGTAGCILSVKDNGVGIDLVKNGSKLFGLNQTFYGNSGARGFGLFITKNQAEAMGATIDVKSTLGEGSTFKIFFN